MKKAIFFVLVTLLLSSVSYAAVPEFINYEGRLTNQQGTPESGTVTMTFAIYDSLSGGSKIWPSSAASESHSVSINEGIFNIILGESYAIPSSAFPSDSTYLEVAVV